MKPVDAKPADGAFQAMDQVANWVRFADTKATIVTAGFGVVVTAVLSKTDVIVHAARGQNAPAAATWFFGIAATVAAVWTLAWLMIVIAPKRSSTKHGINRFAWPTLTTVDSDSLCQRGETQDVRHDAWQQVVNLAVIADRKFSAFTLAGWGFATFIGLSVALVVTAVTATV